MAHLSAIFGMAGSSDTTRFGLLEFPALPHVGMWVPPILEPSQAFLFGSLDFIADQLGMLCLRKKAPVLMPIRGAPFVSSRTPGDLNVEVPALRSEPTLGSNPTMSNVHIILYSLFTIFRRFFGETPLSLLRPSCDRFPYGLVSPANMYAQGFRRMSVLPPLMSKFVGMVNYASTCFLDLMDDDVESDGSSIGDVAPSHCPS